MKIAEVVINISTNKLDKFFDYLIPEDLDLKIGDRVSVPFSLNNKIIAAFVVNIREIIDEEPINLKFIKSKFDNFDSLPEESIKIMQFMKEKQYIRYIDSLSLFVPRGVITKKSKIKEDYSLIFNKDFENEDFSKIFNKQQKKQKELAEYMRLQGEVKKEDIKIYSKSTIDSLINKNIILKKFFEIKREVENYLKREDNKYTLTEDQKKAINKILNQDKTVTLLRGVTGCGKTEIYMALAQKILNEGKNIIILVPEIALTPQTLAIFKARFSDYEIGVIHSKITQAQRFDVWRSIINKTTRIVIGARSAIFAPIENIGLIVIDEEHDSSYTSDSNPRYKTIEIAKFRAEYNNAKLVLGSATPSIESYYNAKTGQYNLVEIEKRVFETIPPKVEIVNMREEILKGNISSFSRLLEKKLKEEVDKKRQAILFLNRRGYMHYTICSSCKYIPECSHCDTRLVYHKENNKEFLECHYCNSIYNNITNCPKCGGRLLYRKLGTQKIEEEAKKIISSQKVLRFDKDATNGSDKKHAEIIEKFSEKKADVLVGTQMVTKGHDFSNVTLVGIVDIDSLVYSQGYKSNENLYQIVTQVAGRAGRSKNLEGTVILQTTQPDKKIIDLIVKNNYKDFYDNEIKIRELMQLPPFSQYIKILISSQNEKPARKVAQNIFIEIKDNIDKNFIYKKIYRTSVIAKVKDYYRFEIILKIKNEYAKIVKDKLFEIIEDKKEKINNVSIFFEIDPKNV